jgi:four helix bundle protein
MNSERIHNYKELRIYQHAVDAAMLIFGITKSFPTEEKYSMVDQIHRSSRSVCANIAEAWRKRRYKAAFIAKLNDVESEACETQVWADLALRCGYIDQNVSEKIEKSYDQIIGQAVRMIEKPEKWLIK